MKMSTASSPPPAWTTNLVARMRRHVVLKTLGVSALTWLFFIGYFHLLRHPAYPPLLMPLTTLDHLIPFQPAALIPYLSLWLYVGIAPGLQWTFLELVVYGLWIVAMCVAGLALFYFWPTSVPPGLSQASAFPGFGLLKGVDAAGNACPSMHVAAAVFSAIWLEHLLRRVGAPRLLRLLNAAWFAAIVYSTLAIKQHVVLDAVAGALLGIAFALPSLRWRPGRQPAGPAAADIICANQAKG
jgi:membrane-associated phospholipid phosphatase